MEFADGDDSDFEIPEFGDAKSDYDEVWLKEMLHDMKKIYIVSLLNFYFRLFGHFTLIGIMIS